MMGCTGASQREPDTSLQRSWSPHWGHKVPLGEDIPADPPHPTSSWDSRKDSQCQMGFPLCFPSPWWPQFLATTSSSSMEKSNHSHPMSRHMGSGVYVHLPVPPRHLGQGLCCFSSLLPAMSKGTALEGTACTPSGKGTSLQQSCWNTQFWPSSGTFPPHLCPSCRERNGASRGRSFCWLQMRLAAHKPLLYNWTEVLSACLLQAQSKQWNNCLRF